MLYEGLIEALKERIDAEQKIQQGQDDRELTAKERERIATWPLFVQRCHASKFQSCILSELPDDSDWLLRLEGTDDFGLLRDAHYPLTGVFDIAKHILGGRSTALCGVRTGQKVDIRGEILYCSRCLQRVLPMG